MSNQFGIYGASGHAKVILEMMENMGMIISCIYDDDRDKKKLFDYIISNDKSILQSDGIEWIVGVGNNVTRKKIVEKIFLEYGKVIDKSANISRRSEVGVGCVVMPGASINSSSLLGKHCIINTNASVDHDCVLNDFVHVSPNATLCGNVSVGEGTHIGAGAVVIPGIAIGKWCTIGAGSVIVRNIPDHAKVVGNPGRILD